MKRKALILTVTLFSFSCSKQTEETTKHSAADQKPTLPIPRPAGDDQVSVGKCRIVATIVAIDSVLDSGDPSSPCAQHPCRTIARVDSILGYGSSFGAPLTVGQQLSLRFAFTLAPTKGIFKTMTDSYPGLTVGSTFQADVAGSGDAVGAEPRRGPGYSVFGYELRK